MSQKKEIAEMNDDRPDSRHNVLVATERCNSNCLMCSQPPQDRDDADAMTERL